VLWSGRVVDENDTDIDTEALRTFNNNVASDDRVEVVVLTAFDGLTIGVRLTTRYDSSPPSARAGQPLAVAQDSLRPLG
jgi:hypothetical protein